MSISDPAQLLQRIPELQSLVDDPKISRAIESGDPFKVYRALVLAKLFRRLPEHADVLRLLTSERRLFAKPLRGTPSLGNINSVGFGFVGKAEKDLDDSYIALHAFVILFVIPLIPLGAYVVKSTGSRKWQIYARAPLGILGWLYTRGLALSAVVLVLSGAAHSYHESNSQDLLLLNGFDVPLTVNFDHQTITLPAQGRATVNLKAGKVHGTATATNSAKVAEAAGVIDQFDETLNSSDSYSIWNIAGAAPLLLNTIVYSKVAPENPENQGSQIVYCGKRFIELSNVKYAFEEPPKTMSMSKHESSISINHLTVATSDKTPGVLACINYAMDHGLEKEIAKATEALAQLHDWDIRYSSAAIVTAQSVSNAEAMRVAGRIMQAKPGDVVYERMVQNIREAAGQHEALLSEYGERAKQQPDSANAQYLFASLLSGDEGINAMQNLTQKFPQDPNILRSLVWRKAAHGDYQGANNDITRLHKLSPSDAARLLDVEVRIKVALRRGFEAMNLLNAAVRDKVADNRAGHAADFGLVARYFGADPEIYLKALPGDEQNFRALDFYRVRAGLPVTLPQNALLPEIKLAMALRNAPATALTIARDLSRNQISSLGTDQLTLLYGEAVRTNDKVLLIKLQGILHLSKTEETALQGYLRGEDISLEQFDIELDIQAAAYLIRSRNTQLAAAERSALRARAARTDLLHGVISTALNQWQG
ncbi:hypothetical protein QN372_14060 [Undibacterium sp. RTI2.1]|uniref:tetratricopeptide repeat protein n=1 Tax=unclassified Undibacterium TaxID=2630295 RepID=UPI002B228D25|nr:MULTISPECIES: hypothetical protein [unclassified Undibacterium]MEB0031880.1 hypothetical protein [Undibacterium sp. RTI2.1]MEB0118160.1 hypothetical protein [Undibacterium sp. RTI2.2]